MALETLHVPVSLVPGLTAAQLEHGSWYELLEERYGVVIANGLQTIEPTVTNEEESELLERPAPLAGVPVRAHEPDARGRTVEFVRSIYRGDRYRLVAELSQRREPSVVSALRGGRAGRMTFARGLLVLRGPDPEARPARSRGHRGARVHGRPPHVLRERPRVLPRHDGRARRRLARRRARGADGPVGARSHLRRGGGEPLGHVPPRGTARCSTTGGASRPAA